MDRLETVLLFIAYLHDCRDDGRFDALETLVYAWKDGAPPEIFASVGRHLARLAVAKRSATVIDLVERIRERGAL